MATVDLKAVIGTDAEGSSCPEAGSRSFTVQAVQATANRAGVHDCTSRLHSAARLQGLPPCVVSNCVTWRRCSQRLVRQAAIMAATLHPSPARHRALGTEAAARA